MKPREKCIVCVYKINRSNYRGGLKERRKDKDITCSKKCSRIYTRISAYIRNVNYYKDKRNNRDKKNGKNKS